MPDTTIPLQPFGGGVWGFQVPDTGEILVKAVRATFDGSGIAGAWFPAVQVIAPGNVTDGEYPTAASVAAGGSATVDFFPGAEEAASTAAATTQPYAIAKRDGFNVPFNAGTSVADFEPYDGLVSSSSDIILSGAGHIEIDRTGFYEATQVLTVFCSTWPNTTRVSLTMALSGSFSANTLTDTYLGNDQSAGPQTDTLGNLVYLVFARRFLNI